MSKSVFLTGGTGLLGSEVLRWLAENNRVTHVRALRRPTRAVDGVHEKVEWWEGDLLETDTLRGALEGMDAVIHCAGTMPEDPLECDRIHRGATQALIDEARGAGTRRFVHVSSAAVYGDPPQQLTTEEAPLVEANAYAHARIASEEVVRAARGALQTAIFRPCPILGAGHLIRGALDLLGQQTLPLPGGGRGPLSFVAADDAAWTLVQAAMDDELHEGPFNLAAAETLSLRELLLAVAAASGRGADSVRFHELSIAEALEHNQSAAQRGEPPPIVPALIALAHEHTFASDRVRRELGYQDRRDLRTVVADAVAAVSRGE